MRYRYYRRRFLNRRGFHAGGYVLATVEDTSKQKDRRGCAAVDLTLADCGRQISLDLDVCPRDLDNTLHKVDLLIDTLTQLRAALVEEGRLEAKREARRKKKAAAGGAAAPAGRPVVRRLG